MKVFEVGDAKYVFALSRYIISVPDSVRLTNSRSVTVFFLKNLEKNSLTYEILTESDVLGTPWLRFIVVVFLDPYVKIFGYAPDNKRSL